MNKRIFRLVHACVHCSKSLHDSPSGITYCSLACETLRMLQGGALNDHAGELLADIVKGVADTGRAGRLTITIDIKKSGAALSVRAKATDKTPEELADDDFFWPLMWVLLQAFADQLKWPVNGELVKLTPEEWKDLLSAAYKPESQRVAMGIDGGMVMLGLRTSKMGKREFAEFVDFIHATAAARGVVIEEMEATT